MAAIVFIGISPGDLSVIPLLLCMANIPLLVCLRLLVLVPVFFRFVNP
jgi:hypothetical protein